MSFASSRSGAAVAVRRTPLAAAACAALSALAALPLLLGTGPAKAQTTPAATPVVQLERVTVTANRFEALLDELPAGVTLITAEQIRNSGASTANEAIWRLAGVPSTLSTGLDRDRTLDLRGFGATAGSNTVVLIDGVRLNEGDSMPASLSWLPVDAIDRIEITRGSGAVLYGEGATAGVIHIVTRKHLARSGGSLTGRVGSHGTGELRGEGHIVAGPWSVQVAGSTLDTDQHRDNYALRDHNATLKLQWAQDGTRLGVNLASQQQSGRLPGGLTSAEADTTPTLSHTPTNWGTNHTDLAGLVLETEAGGWLLAADASLRHKDSASFYDSPTFPYLGTSSARIAQAGVRAQREVPQAALTHQLTLGLDLERWGQERNDGTLISQNGQGAFLNDDVALNGTGTRVQMGVRRMWADRVAAGYQTNQITGANNLWNLGLSQRLSPQLTAHARWGRSVRLANADEYTCYAPYTCSSLNTNLLAPQSSHDVELGLRMQSGAEQSQLRLYRHLLTQEIGYNANAGGNINFDPTLREGLELTHRHQLNSALAVQGQLALRRAVFRSGTYAGKQLPQTSRANAALRLMVTPTAGQRLELGGQWQSAQRVTEDFANTCAARIAGGALLDARYAMDWQNWEFALQVNNLADRRYASLRTVCAASARSVYPEPGRALMLSARVNF